MAVTRSVDIAIAGQGYTLECKVAGTEMLTSVNITYEWTRGNSTVSNMAAYTFIPTTGDDGVMYHCAVTVNSSSLSTPITSRGSSIISVSG